MQPCVHPPQVYFLPFLLVAVLPVRCLLNPQCTFCSSNYHHLLFPESIDSVSPGPLSPLFLLSRILLLQVYKNSLHLQNKLGGNVAMLPFPGNKHGNNLSNFCVSLAFCTFLRASISYNTTSFFVLLHHSTCIQGLV